MGSPQLDTYIGWHNVKAFGAVNPNNLYDALVKANAECNGAGVIVIPPGAYVLATAFSPSSGVTLIVSEGVTLSGAGSLSAGSGAIVDLRGGLKVSGTLSKDGTALAASFAEVNAVADNQSIAAAAALTAKRFVAVNRQTAAVDSTTVIGVTPSAIAEAASGAVGCSGLQPVTADCALVAGDAVKVGTAGRASKLNAGAQVTLQTAIAGEASAFAALPAAERLANPGFEDAGGGGADVWASWTETAGDGAIANETTTKHGGSDAAKLTAGATPAASPIVSQAIAVVPGHTYNVSFWTAGDGTNAGRWGLYDVTHSAYLGSYDKISTAVTAGVYAQKTASIVAPAGCLSMRLDFLAPAVEGGIAYFDDASIVSADGQKLEAVQAADVAADRGRVIVVEGADGDGNAASVTLTLNATNTTTPSPVASAVLASVSGVYTQSGAALGAQDVTIRLAGGGGTVCTLAGTTSELGADIPAQSTEAYCQEVTVTGPNGNTTQVTLVGVDSADAVARERLTLDGSSPSVATSTTVFRVVNRICLGEFTNAGAGAVKTNATTDTAAMKVGTVVVAAAARGDDATVLLKPNA